MHLFKSLLNLLRSPVISQRLTESLYREIILATNPRYQDSLRLPRYEVFFGGHNRQLAPGLSSANGDTLVNQPV